MVKDILMVHSFSQCACRANFRMGGSLEISREGAGIKPRTYDTRTDSANHLAATAAFGFLFVNYINVFSAETLKNKDIPRKNFNYVDN